MPCKLLFLEGYNKKRDSLARMQENPENEYRRTRDSNPQGREAGGFQDRWITVILVLQEIRIKIVQRSSLGQGRGPEGPVVFSLNFIRTAIYMTYLIQLNRSRPYTRVTIRTEFGKGESGRAPDAENRVQDYFR